MFFQAVGFASAGGATRRLIYRRLLTAFDGDMTPSSSLNPPLPTATFRSFASSRTPLTSVSHAPHTDRHRRRHRSPAMAAPPPPRLPVLLAILLTLSPLPPLPASASAVGINYGQVADNLPSPSAVVPLLRSLGVSRVKIYDADPAVLRAFAGTGVDFVVGLADECVARVCDPDKALAWVKANVAAFLPRTKISAVTVGNEVLTGNNTALVRSLLPAMQGIHSALAQLGLDKQVAVTTAHSLAVLETSYPPSAGSFRRDLVPYVCDIINFLAKTGSPFLINAYPYFAYKADPKKVSLDYVLFQSAAGVVDPGSNQRYMNMLHAQVDAVYTAIDRLAGKGKGAVEVRVSETGWPSNGDPNEAGATAENARRYNGNLVRMASEKTGTPMRPNSTLQVYIFALFNENLKPGPASERNYGLFKPDGTPVYLLGAAAAAAAPNASSGGGDDTAGGGIGPDWGNESANSSSGFYTISSATKVGFLPGFRLIFPQMAAPLLVAGFFLGAVAVSTH